MAAAPPSPLLRRSPGGTAASLDPEAAVPSSIFKEPLMLLLGCREAGPWFGIPADKKKTAPCPPLLRRRGLPPTAST